jgi:TonB-linked SusC/RagA family outer membrane protein
MKKFRDYYGRIPLIFLPKKTIRVMKLTLFLSILTISQLWATETYSQMTKLKLKLENVKVSDALKEIENQSEFFFLYSPKLIDVERKVNIDVEKESIKDILSNIFDDKVKFVVHDRQIILSPNEISEVLSAAQQKNQISGTVIDKNGAPQIGVNVVVTGTTLGTITDVAGKYSIEVPPGSKSLTYTFIGMQPQEISIGTLTQIDVTMVESSIGLDEVVVIGYGTQKKSTLTGSVSTAKGESLKEVPVPNVSQAIAGNVTGVSMRPISGQPGLDNPELYIRGVVTTGNSAPLIVIDGVQRSSLQQIDMNSIENITILKDAAAVAPFGIGGANGVILITTKRGQTGKPTLKFSSSYAIQNPTYVPKLLNAKDYMSLQNEAYFNLNPTGTAQPYDPEMVSNYNQLHVTDPWKYPSSSFVDETFKSNVPVKKVNFDLSGGTETFKYYAGLGYFDQQGIFDPVKYKRYNFNINFDAKVTKTTGFFMSLMGTVENLRDLDSSGGEGGNIANGGFLRGGYKWVPTQPLFYPDGVHFGENQGYSIIGVLKSNGYTKTTQNDLLISVGLEQQLPFIKGLSMKGVFSYDPRQSDVKGWHLPIPWYSVDLTTNPYTFTKYIATNPAIYTFLQQSYTKRVNYTYQGYLNYNRSFGLHNVSGLLVAEARNSTYAVQSSARNYFAVPIDEMDLGPSNKLNFNNGGYSSSSSMLGFVYRLTYNFKERYLFEASGRYDGHYFFAPGKRWAYFPSFSAAWKISEEGFIKDISQITSLKLRGSWGKSGNLAGSPFQYLTGYTLRGDAYAFGNGSLVQSSYVSIEANPNITWEVGTKTDVGFDLTMWGSLLSLEFDYFHEDRNGMLLPPQVTLPVEYGLSIAEENKGIMKNNGIELSIGSRKTFSNGIDLAMKLNFSYSRNQMIEVFESDAQRLNPNRTLKGKPFGTPFGYKSDGLFSTKDDKNGDGIIDITEYPVEQFGTVHPGDIKYVDLSGPNGVPDGIIDVNDETKIGYPYYPLMTYGFTTSMKWKGVDLSIFLQGSAMSSMNIQQWSTVPFANNASNTAYEYFNNRWTPTHQNAKYPKAYPAPTANNSQISDFWQINNSFLRLKTAIIGYSIPAKITKKLTIENIRIYLAGQNLLTFSKLKHLDPEASYVGGDVGREDSYPQMRSTTFGIDITF